MRYISLFTKYGVICLSKVSHPRKNCIFPTRDVSFVLQIRGAECKRSLSSEVFQQFRSHLKKKYTWNYNMWSV